MSDTHDNTIVSLFSRRVAADRARPAIHYKSDRVFQTRTWGELESDVRRAAAFLVALGIQPGERIAQWSENRYEWVVTDLAIQLVQAIHVPIHVPLSATQAAYQIRHSGAVAVIFSGAEQLAKLASVEEPGNTGLLFLSHDLVNDRLHGRPVLGWPASAGDDAEQFGADLQDKALAQLTPASLATILYTSGTTGDPLGVALTHGNLVSNAIDTLTTMGERATDVRVSFLPFSHIFARTCDMYTWIGVGAEIALAASRETVIEDCQTMRPTLLNGVPYFYERVRRRLLEAGTADQPDSIRRLLGGRLRICCCGGSALPNDVFDFFAERQLPILQGYGLTESSPVLTVSTRAHYRRGSVGRPLPNIDLRIAGDGEILARGPSVMSGYWQDEERTNQAIRDGWLHTGDLGVLDSDAFLRITGRKKELIVTATGKNIAPALIEARLCRDPLIEHAMVVGDNCDYLSALVVPHTGQLKNEISDQQLSVPADRRALADPCVLELFRQRILQHLADLSPQEQIQQFTLLDRQFTVESGHLTAKGSLRRDAIRRDFAREISQLGEASD